MLDYVGTVSFAMSGAATAGMRGMNLLGCVFVGVIAATGGGTTRDLLLGQTPVFWLVEVGSMPSPLCLWEQQPFGLVDELPAG